MRLFLTLSLLTLLFFKSKGQDTNARNPNKLKVNGEVSDNNTLASASKKPVNTVYAHIVDGDTIAFVTLREVTIYAPRTFKSHKEAQRYDKLVRDVKKAYPYAKIAGAKLKEYNEKLNSFKTEKARKEYLISKEKEMKAEFEKDLRNLTLRQGRILIKLVDRETGNTSYELVKELRGTFSAFMWQSLARMFGSNLKDQYDASGDDKMIEEIVVMIEKGEI